MPDCLLEFIRRDWPITTAELRQQFRVMRANGLSMAGLPADDAELDSQLRLLAKIGSIQGDESGWAPGQPRRKEAGLLF